MISGSCLCSYKCYFSGLQLQKSSNYGVLSVAVFWYVLNEVSGGMARPNRVFGFHYNYDFTYDMQFHALFPDQLDNTNIVYILPNTCLVNLSAFYKKYLLLHFSA